MRGTTILIATTLTLGYGLAAHAAISADRAETIRRVAGISAVTPSPAEAASRVWYGGMLAPVVVEAAAEREVAKCYLAYRET